MSRKGRIKSYPRFHPFWYKTHLNYDCNVSQRTVLGPLRAGVRRNPFKALSAKCASLCMNCNCGYCSPQRVEIILTLFKRMSRGFFSNRNQKFISIYMVFYTDGTREFPSGESMVMTDPSLALSSRIILAARVSTSFCMNLFRGLAPYTGSNPLSAI